MEYFRQDMNYTNENKRRFIKEDFLDYELLKKNIENNEENIETGNNNNNSSLYSESSFGSMKNMISKYNITYEKSLKIINLGKINKEEIEIVNDEEFKKIDSYIAELLVSEKELQREKYVFILSHMMII